jgi:hypothetical protein
MSRQTSTSDEVTISDADMARFHRQAPAALGRRGVGFVVETLANSLEHVAMGAAPIIGMFWFGWSAAQLFVFLLAAAWVGILCDTARTIYAGHAVRAYAQTFYDDWHVWVVVEALRAGRTTAPRSHLKAKYEPESGVIVDFVFGGMSTVVMVLQMKNLGFAGQDGVIAGRSFAISLIVLAIYQTVTAAWEISRHRRGGEAIGRLKAMPGMRGFGLFMLMFVMLMASDTKSGGGGIAAGRVMLIVNGAIIAFGLLNVIGLVWIRPETVWLRDYLRSRAAGDQ